MVLREKLAFSFILLSSFTQPTFADSNVTRGQSLYQEMCMSCHAIDHNGVGPAHKNVFGRKAGTQPGYSYSSALESSNIIWNAANLDEWLRNPEKFVPGQKMWIEVASAQDRADLIAYLKSISSSPLTPSSKP